MDTQLPVAARLEVAELFRGVRARGLLPPGMSPEQRSAARAIERCRTAALGGHLMRCLACGLERPRYNSCRNRHCPRCQGLAQARWLEARMARMLPVPCFHVVFTLPEQLRSLARLNPRLLYALLFRSASRTLLKVAADARWVGGLPGITCVLHTWRRDLGYHPHLHCLITAGGLDPDGQRWHDADPNLLAPVRVLGRVFRGMFMEGLLQLKARRELVLPPEVQEPRAFQDLVDGLYGKRWQVFAKRPFGGARQVFEYLGRYTHRVAISSARLRAFDGATVTFATRGDLLVQLPVEVFVARFLQHVLPRGFTKIRHTGLWAPSNLSTRLATARALLAGRVEHEVEAAGVGGAEAEPEATNEGDGWASLLLTLTGLDAERCPGCGQRALIEVPIPAPTPKPAARAPPNRGGP